MRAISITRLGLTDKFVLTLHGQQVFYLTVQDLINLEGAATYARLNYLVGDVAKGVSFQANPGAAQN